MNTKLTLRLDDNLIQSAKEYSARTGKSVSKLVADYFVVIKNEKLRKKQPISPTVASLKGILKDVDLSKEDYHRHLEKKHI